jgi:hypothetical protein
VTAWLVWFLAKLSDVTTIMLVAGACIETWALVLSLWRTSAPRTA